MRIVTTADWEGHVSALGRTLAIMIVLALGTRAATSEPLVAARLIGAGAVVSVLVGVARRWSQHDRLWQRTWVLLTGSVAMAAAGVVGAAGGGPSIRVMGLRLTASLFLLAALMVLSSHRLSRARAMDLLLEGLALTTAAALVAWALVPVGAGVVTPHAAVAAMADLTGLWILGRLLLLTGRPPRAYWYLAGGLLVSLSAHSVGIATTVAGVSTPTYTSALDLWMLCLFAAAALHPSLAETFEPVPVTTEGLTRSHVALSLLGILVGPAAIGWRLLTTGASGTVVLAGTTLLPALLIGHLILQVQERAKGQYRAQHDALTGLPNRVLFEDRLHLALAHARRMRHSVAVMFCDLDRFKQINDSLGHEVGDAVLRAVASRLRRTLREEDTVARIGGDEFTILLGQVDDQDDCAHVANKLLSAFSEPFEIDGRELFLGASIGIATYPDDGEDAAALLKHADIAMYRAKARSRNTFQLYSSSMSTQAQIRHALETGFRSALEVGQLSLHYQPRISQKDGSVVGVEALARWRHPELGYISPTVFVPLAEDSGLIERLGRWVLQTATTQVQQWRQDGILDVPVSVNLSARQFHEPAQLEQLVTETLRTSGLSPDRLELELTESVLIRDQEAVSAALQSLRDLGVRTSIDDFGTGYSGLSYLANMPIDTLKIDRAFIAAIHDRGTRAPLVEAVIALARSLDMNVVGEGVETQLQARYLQTRGCDELQGHLYARALEPDLFHRAADFAKETGLPLLTAIEHLEQLEREVGPVYTPRISASQLELLLDALKSDDAAEAIDPSLVATAIAVLLPQEPHPLTWSEHMSMRVAAGTFAGLVPLSTGLAAGGALPDPAQQVAAQVLDHLGIQAPDRPATDDPLLLAAHPSRAGTNSDTPAPPPAPPETSSTDPEAVTLAASASALIEEPPPPTPATTARDHDDQSGSAAAATSPGPGTSTAAPQDSTAPPSPTPAGTNTSSDESDAPPSPGSGAPGQTDAPQDDGAATDTGTPPNQDGAPADGAGTPGNSGDAPGRTGTAPGQTGTPPGNSGSAPGQADAAPGGSGGAPGQTDAAPGRSGSAPGHTGDTPGNAGSAAGRTNSAR